MLLYKDCDLCHRQFIAKTNNQKYCSNWCRNKAMANHWKARSEKSGKRTNYSNLPQELKMLYGCRQRAKLKNLICNLELTDILIPKVCPILGIPLYAGSLEKTDNSPSLDRIDNTKGYIKENIQIISLRANRIKNDATVEELEKIVSFLKKGLDKT